jgi:hypothetical protein
MTRMPSAVVYGYLQDHESYAIYEAGNALDLAAEWRAIFACTSVAEFFALLPTLKLNFAGYDEEDFEGMTDPFDISELPGVADCDWPPMATSNALELFDPTGPVIAALRAEAGAKVVRTTLSGDYLDIPKDRESEMLAVLARHGISATRDDDFVALTMVPYQ